MYVKKATILVIGGSRAKMMQTSQRLIDEGYCAIPMCGDLLFKSGEHETEYYARRLYAYDEYMLLPGWEQNRVAKSVALVARGLGLSEFIENTKQEAI